MELLRVVVVVAVVVSFLAWLGPCDSEDSPPDQEQQRDLQDLERRDLW